MKILSVVLFVLALAASCSAQEVTFACSITGSGASGFDVHATNPGPVRKKCRATCTVTRSDGSTRSWSYEGPVNAAASAQRQWFGGEAGVPGAPLSKPTISNASCD